MKILVIAFSLCSSNTAEIGTDSDKYFIGASPIYEYNRDGSSITAQTAIYAASIRFILEETSSESIAAQKSVKSRKPYRKINAVLILQESGRFWSKARFAAEADSVFVSQIIRTARSSKPYKTAHTRVAQTAASKIL